jgi:ubiquinone/menaquinone biosynthesis C-methylase UbiE
MKEFWDEQARLHGENLSAVNFDLYVEKISNKLLEKLIGDSVRLCDFGCGNGKSLMDIAASRPQSDFVGYDYSENMIAAAERGRQKLNLRNVRFQCFDATNNSLPSDSEGKFDIVLAKRLLINVKGAPRIQVLKNISGLLKKGGQYIMMECFIEPLERVNLIRKIIGLDEIKVKAMNEYLTQDIFKEIDRLFVLEKKIDIGSMYYFTSRIFNAALSEGAPKYETPINELAWKLTDADIIPMQGYAPEVTHLLRKR